MRRHSALASLRGFSTKANVAAPPQAVSGSQKLWGGRFTKDTDNSIKFWTDSIPVDRYIAVEDMFGSQAHVTMLGCQGIIPAENAGKILGALLNLQNKYIAKTWDIGSKQEDVHMDVEQHVIEATGIDVGGRMHTCRSRNDQVVLDSKLYARNKLIELREKVILAAKAFVDRAEPHLNDVMVAYTHVQHAQPVSVAYWLSHYAAILIRDLDRLASAYDVTDENPLGSGAIAGTSYPIDRNLTSKLMGFKRVHEHGLDATSARDFMLDGLSAQATLYTTYSRLAEEFILWSSKEFESLTLDDGFAMGSSMMPQKKNPGALELLRGRSGRVNGLLTAGYTMMKGLPSGYNRDFHEDKEIMVSMFNIVIPATEVIAPLVNSTKINLARMKVLPDLNFSCATELANFLVAVHKVPFRSAHHIVGSLVGVLSRAGKNFNDRETCQKHLAENGVTASLADIHKVLDGAEVMKSYNSLGGTGPKAVKDMLVKYRVSLDKHTSRVAADRKRIADGYNACRNIAGEAGSVKTVADLKALVAKYASQLPEPTQA